MSDYKTVNIRINEKTRFSKIGKRLYPIYLKNTHICIYRTIIMILKMQ